MKLLWCWRCKTEMPMLDENEFRQVLKTRSNQPGETLEQQFAPVLREYEQITGYHETNLNAVFHHQLSLYGPPCAKCGKPLRSPRASFCAACGEKVRTLKA
jgi:hypothetical protein